MEELISGSVVTGCGACFSLKPCSSSNSVAARNSGSVVGSISSSVGSNRNSSSVESGNWGATADTLPSLQPSQSSGNYGCNGGSSTSRSSSSHPRPPSSNSKQHFGPGRCCGSLHAASFESGEPGVPHAAAPPVSGPAAPAPPVSGPAAPAPRCRRQCSWLTWPGPHRCLRHCRHARHHRGDCYCLQHDDDSFYPPGMA